MAHVKGQVVLCLQAFRVLSDTISKTDTGDSGHHDASDNSQSQVLPLATVSDQVARFKIWVGNIGADGTRTASLDRLRKAPHVQAQLIRLLRDLREALKDGKLPNGESLVLTSGTV
jgi:hypothetical protein